LVSTKQGYLATNIAQNVQIPHGVSFHFRRTGTSLWVDLGDLGGDVSIEPTVDFFEFQSRRSGLRGVSKRILSSRGITIEATLNEVAPENIRLAFFGGAETSANATLYETAIPAKVGAGAGTWTLPDTTGVTIDSVRSIDGESTYTDGVEYTDAAGVLTAEATGAMFDAAVGTRVHVTYSIAKTDIKKFEMLSTTTQEGAAQFQIRNNNGGLGQIYELDSVHVAPNGALNVPVEDPQSLPVTLTAQEVNGLFGRVYYFDV